MVDSDKHWARLGRIDPYLSTVKTLDPYKLDPTLGRDIDAYFESGERYLSDLFEAIRLHIAPGFKPRLGVDFGCSVGRVAIPLARRCQSIIGLDVSTDALGEAERNATRLGTTNARWLASDDDLSRLTEPIDLFHSYNVLQHMPVPRGAREGMRRRVLQVHRPGALSRRASHCSSTARLKRVSVCQLAESSRTHRCEVATAARSAVSFPGRAR